MKNKVLATLLVVSLLTSITVLSLQTREVSAANEHVKVYIDPPSFNKGPGDLNSFFNVTVTIANVTDLFGFDINITWNNALITFD